MASGDNWVFDLSNLNLHRGDERSEIPLPSNALTGNTPGSTINRILLSLGGREWTLIDLTVGKKPLPRSETDGNALVSGMLSTSVREGESQATLEPSADAIAMLISFATCRDVAAFKCSRVSGDGKNIQPKLRSTKIHLYSEGGSPLINNSTPGELRSFLERAYPILQENPQWWLASLDIFVQARMNSFMEIRSALLNILLDRVSGFYPENRQGGEIDELDVTKLSEVAFKEKVTTLLTEVCPKWTLDFTEKMVVSYLANCNAKPSFAKGIQRVCGINNLPAPTGAFLSTRNKLLHEGTLSPKNGDAKAYMTQLDWLAARVLMRMLGYEGNYFHQFTGAMQNLKSELATT